MSGSRMIAQDKCIGCGKCVDDCVNGYLTLTSSGEGKKTAAFSEKGRCIDCGHCNAICPAGAVSGGNLEPLPDDADELLSMMAMKRTVRRFIKDAVISREDLDRIVFAAQSAPTDRNRRSARIIFVKEKLKEIYDLALDHLVEEVSKAGTINPLYCSTMQMNEKREEVLWNAEYLVVFAGRMQSSVDAAIAAERMQLEAFRSGIGTAYRGDMQLAINNVEEIRELLGLKSYEAALVAFAMGVAAPEYLRPAVKANKKVVYM